MSLLLVLLLVAWGAWILRDRRHPPAPPSSTTPSVAQAATPVPLHMPAPPPRPILTPLPVPSALPPGMSADDTRTADGVAQRLALHAPLTTTDLARVQALCDRYPSESGLRDLLFAAVVTVANQDRQNRQYPSAAAGLRRAIVLRPGETALRLSLVSLLNEMADWSGAEAAAREALALAPDNADVLEALAFALFRQDRNREALDVVRKAVEIRPTPTAQALLARLEKSLSDESGMTEQRLAHFDVRYDGEAHGDVGREILRELERHYATLTRAFDHTPTATIPVILFTQQAYYDASGAPAWSGGVYDNFDGRIRIPVMGVSAALTPEMDGTLIHELTHAFIFDISRGVAPRDFHEGVAQYMEGKRLASILEPQQITALANGRIPGVGGFYLGALSFAEYLYALRGQGGINDVLRAMGETGNLDESFRRVYGQDYTATQRAWTDRLRQQYGG